MKAEDKAKELISKMLQYQMIVSDEEYSLNNAKQCALICIDEIQKNHPHKIVENKYVDSGGNDTDESYFKMVSNEFFWQEVKQEINK